MRQRNYIGFYSFIVTGIVLIITNSCKKEKSDTITDIDGNTYNTVAIGSQIWIKENLKTLHYLNGDPVINITENAAWITAGTGAWSDYDNDLPNSADRGHLYNWYAVADARGLCPTGWHIPSDEEWTELITYLGGEGIAGGKLKETGFSHWTNPNFNATNESGFTAVSGGLRFTDGSFIEFGQSGSCWSASEFLTTKAWIMGLDYRSENVVRGPHEKQVGFSVRCLKDQ
jgi:uncharacterized protein (TIGR02145 family)